MTVSELESGLCEIRYFGEKEYYNKTLKNVLIDVIKYDGNIEGAVEEGIKLLKLI